MTPRAYDAIVIGASAGAVEALSVLLPPLPADYALPIFIVVHLPPDKRSAMAELFKAKCRINVKEAEDKESIQPGCIYFAPPDYHLLVEVDGRLSLSSDEQVHYSRPSIDVLFESAADAYGERLMGMILTGANADGARGLKAIENNHGMVYAQDPATAYAELMPSAALKLCPSAQALNLDQLAMILREALST